MPGSSSGGTTDRRLLDIRRRRLCLLHGRGAGHRRRRDPKRAGCAYTGNLLLPGPGACAGSAVRQIRIAPTRRCQPTIPTAALFVDDLDSGIAGYQNHCVQCVQKCRLCSESYRQPVLDLDPKSAQASIDTIGFETCANLGPGCLYDTQQGIGGCVPTTCSTDADCAGSATNSLGFVSVPREAEPFCIAGLCRTASSVDTACPNCYCESDVSCPDSLESCDMGNDHCACTSSAQCSGAWPICELSDGGDVGDGGALLGSCGCERDEDCGDGGLSCLNLGPGQLHLRGQRMCLVDCMRPQRDSQAVRTCLRRRRSVTKQWALWTVRRRPRLPGRTRRDVRGAVLPAGWDLRVPV